MKRGTHLSGLHKPQWVLVCYSWFGSLLLLLSLDFKIFIYNQYIPEKKLNIADEHKIKSGSYSYPSRHC